MRDKIPERGIVAGICVGLIGLVWFVFGQTIKFPFINFDDPEYVYEVPEINSGVTLQNLKWAFTHTVAANWHRLNPFAHIGFRILRRKSGRASPDERTGRFPEAIQSAQTDLELDSGWKLRGDPSS